MTTLDEARAALRDRLGAGARYDAAEAPAEALAWARLGTAYFARMLNELPDAGLDAPSLLPGASRRHVVAEVGYQARALTRLTEAAAAGRPGRMYDGEAARLREVTEGASLPARALRHLFTHAATHLDVEWRDLSGPAWQARVSLPGDREGPVAETPWIRARTLWLRSLDLDSGASFRAAPPAFLDRLLDEAAAGWTGPALQLDLSDRPAPLRAGGDGGTRLRLSGTAAGLARWITGRGGLAGAPDLPAPTL